MIQVRRFSQIFRRFFTHFYGVFEWQNFKILFRYKNRLGKSFIIGWSNWTNAKTVTKPKEFSMSDKFTSFNTE